MTPSSSDQTCYVKKLYTRLYTFPLYVLGHWTSWEEVLNSPCPGCDLISTRPTRMRSCQGGPAGINGCDEGEEVEMEDCQSEPCAGINNFKHIYSFTFPLYLVCGVHNIDYSGFDLGDAVSDIADSQQCQDLCKALQGCFYFVYVPAGGVCYRKV